MIRIVIGVLLAFLYTALSSQQVIVKDLKHWRFRQADVVGVDYLAQIPSCIHTDLLVNNLISDPFYGANEDSLQWINQTNWVYENHFLLTAKELKSGLIRLVFEGLDTDAKVSINGHNILIANNMFLKYELDITQFVEKKNYKIYDH